MNYITLGYTKPDVFIRKNTSERAIYLMLSVSYFREANQLGQYFL